LWCTLIYGNDRNTIWGIKMTKSISSDLITGGPENNSQSAEKTRQF
jgi:hypothetical protein